jgi:Domain of unknown function (DUF4382)
MNSRLTRVLVGFVAALAFIISGCGSSSSSSNTPGTQTGQMSMMVSDDPATDWAEIGVKVLSISLKPQGGGTPVVVFNPNPVPVINLVELDQLADILDNVSVPAGTYTGATLTLSANPGDVALTASSDPEPGFAGTPGEIVPSSQIQIQGATGSVGNLTVPLNINFVSPLVVTAGQNSAMDLEFNLSHPAFIVAHAPLGGGQTIWAVNFTPALRHHPIFDVTRLVLRHLYGSLVSVSSDNTSITITRVFPVEPPTNPETSVASSRNLTVLADKANGTLFYDMDAHTKSTIMDFSSVASALTGKFLRIAARYQVDGSLVAVRMWVSSSFNTVWISPEGHVLHVMTSTSSLVLDNEDGVPVTVKVDGNTQFFFRTPANPSSDAKPICTGTACLSNLVRGFKVHITADPLQNPLLAQTVDIEIARFGGAISSPTQASFVYTRHFATSASPDDYTKTMPYISSSTPNGHDPLSGKAILGFKWWNFTFPTIVDSGTNAISDFVSATGGSANFGGTVGALTPVGGSYATWNDPANPNGWSAPWTVLVPAPVPFAKVAVGWVTNGNIGDFTITAAGGTNQVTVDASTVSGSATLVYQVDRTNGIVTISPVDLTTAGLNTVQTNLTPATLVKVFGVPQPNGSIKAYVFFYFTGNLMPAS